MPEGEQEAPHATGCLGPGCQDILHDLLECHTERKHPSLVLHDSPSLPEKKALHCLPLVGAWCPCRILSSEPGHKGKCSSYGSQRRSSSSAFLGNSPGGAPNIRVATAGGIPSPLLCQLQISDSTAHEAQEAVLVLVAPCTGERAALVLREAAPHTALHHLWGGSSPLMEIPGD